ncbi:MarR family transcriptional regulator [Candidatus Woesearchaeota archaeon]|nr:MarR family transcriptional regulator [Candidatus Woesearchaeota archaeon]
MIICFVYAGISLVLLVYEVYSFARFQRMPFNGPMNDSLNISRMPGSPRNAYRPQREYPMLIFASSLGLVISSLAGFTIMDLLRKKEKKELTKSVMDTMLTPEEKNVIKVLEEYDGELTQSEIVRRTKLSKVKVHRIVKRLESLNVVSKYPYGVTNKIKLEQKMLEE